MAARSIRISDVTINQGVSVPVVDNAAPVSDRWAPIVAGRYGMFPLSDFEVSIGQVPHDFDRSIGAGGEGWSDLLNECLSLRANDDASPNTYYCCAVRPTIDVGDFCAQGCVAGLGPVPRAGDTFSRAAIGLLYDNGIGTFVHEIGHTLGLPHAPCGGAAGADPEFPYSDGGIGVLGFPRRRTSMSFAPRPPALVFRDLTG